ncbi:MAG: HEAT repeat domain-containing protein [Bryobacteraceae bacterium]
MSCDWVKGSLSFFLYGELTFEEEEAVHKHLETCEPCRTALDKEKALHAALDLAAVEPPAGLLSECRSALDEQIGGMRDSRGWLGRLWDWTGRPVSPALLRPAGALALVAVGFFAARLIPQPPPPPGSRTPSVSQVRYLQPDPSGGVRVVVDESSERVFSGDLGQPRIQSLVLEAAQNSFDPALRLDSLEVLRPQGSSPVVRRAFLQAVQNDPNAAVRLKALEGLRPFASDPEVRSVLSHVLLSDDHVGVRAQAIDLLAEHREDDIVGVLQQLVDREDEGYIRERSQSILQAMNASLGAF